MTDEQKLRAEIKARWCAALRSGKYQQGQAQLRPSEDQFCCLGVLCDLIDPRWNLRPTGDGYNHTSGGVMFTTRPIRAEVGLSTDMEGELMRMNDDGKSFAEIADFIERNI